MKLERLPHEPAALADFFQEGLETLGALGERTWHDRLEIVADGPAARLWNDDGSLQDVELWFPPPSNTTPRDAAKEVFPGCPLTFRLTEALRLSPLILERLVIAAELGATQPPANDVAEKLWHAQFPGTARWRLTGPFVGAHHLSLLALTRVEIQAIDQHWSLHRLAVSLSDGARDETLAATFGFTQAADESAGPVEWPIPDPTSWHQWLQTALAKELAEDIAAIRIRQENYLRRELDRIDAYFAGYEHELEERGARSGSASVKLKTADRLAAAKAEHARRRNDQIARHEIRVHPHLDALLMVAEPAWRAEIDIVRHHEPLTTPALFVPRSRRWLLLK